MATCTFRVGTPDTSNTPNTSDPFTPAVGDLLVVFCVGGNFVDPTYTCTSSVGGFTFTQFAGVDFSLNRIYCFVSDALVASAVSQDVTITHATTASNSTVIHVYSVSGLSSAGLTAVRQFAVHEEAAAGTTLAPTLAAAALTGNPTIGCAAGELNPLAITPPTGWTEPAGGDIGTTTPDIGGAVCHRDSGFTGTTVTWGSTPATPKAAIIVEFDAAAAAGFTPRSMLLGVG